MPHRQTSAKQYSGARPTQIWDKEKVWKKVETGGQGFEPRYAAPEAAVLPLDDPPMDEII